MGPRCFICPHLWSVQELSYLSCRVQREFHLARPINKNNVAAREDLEEMDEKDEGTKKMVGSNVFD